MAGSSGRSSSVDRALPGEKAEVVFSEGTRRRMARIRKKAAGLFLTGPIPISWIVRARKLGCAALYVGLALWFLVKVRGNRKVKLDRFARKAFKLERWTIYRGLGQLESGGLVDVDAGQGRLPVVTVLVTVPDETARLAGG